MSEPKVEEKKAAPQTPPQTPTPTPQAAIGIPPVSLNLNVPVSMPAKTPEAAPSQPAPAQSSSFKAIVVTDTCGFCQGLTDYIKDKGLADKVKIINASTPEGRKFVIDNKIRGVPECVVVAQDGKQVKVCSKEEFVKLLKEGS
jgi:hypothetical protein